MNKLILILLPLLINCAVAPIRDKEPNLTNETFKIYVLGAERYNSISYDGKTYSPKNNTEEFLSIDIAVENISSSTQKVEFMGFFIEQKNDKLKPTPQIFMSCCGFFEGLKEDLKSVTSSEKSFEKELPAGATVKRSLAYLITKDEKPAFIDFHKSATKEPPIKIKIDSLFK